MTLYGYFREPESNDAEAVESEVHQVRFSSAPVSVPDNGGRSSVAPAPLDPSDDEDDELGTARAVPGTAEPFPAKPAEPSNAEPFPAEPFPAEPFPAEPFPAEPFPAPDPEGPVIPPWDRRPLMVVLAAGTALVLLAVLSGVASSAIFGPGPNPTKWLAPQGQQLVPPPATAPVAPPTTADTITLSAVGDLVMGTQPDKLPPRDGEGFFDPVQDVLAADLVMADLETPLTTDTGRNKCGTPPITGCRQLYLPPSYANHLHAAGFQVVSLANNHAHDMGAEGLANTRKALDANGVRHTGAPNQITYVDVKGAKVAVLGFAVYSWAQSLNNLSAAQDLVRKADATADLVVIQMRGGAEGVDKTHVRPGHESFLGEDRGDIMSFSHAVIDAGADVVFGHGPHVMRGMEFYKGRLIAYSLGSFCGYGVPTSTGLLGVGGVVKVTLTRDGSWTSGQLIATEMVNGGMPAPDADKRALALVNGLSSEDFGAAAARISTSDGAINPPPPNPGPPTPA